MTYGELPELWADLVINGLRPAVLAALLSLFTLGYSIKRRSLRPVAFIGVACLATVAVTAATKIAVGRLDPHGNVGNDGGSFPSGHTIAVVVCLGLGVRRCNRLSGGWSGLFRRSAVF